MRRRLDAPQLPAQQDDRLTVGQRPVRPASGEAATSAMAPFLRVKGTTGPWMVIPAVASEVPVDRRHGWWRVAVPASSSLFASRSCGHTGFRTSGRRSASRRWHGRLLERCRLVAPWMFLVQCLRCRSAFSASPPSQRGGCFRCSSGLSPTWSVRRRPSRPRDGLPSAGGRCPFNGGEQNFFRNNRSPFSRACSRKRTHRLL